MKQSVDVIVMYEKQKIIQANKDTLIYLLDNKGKWLENLLREKYGNYNKFINQMAREIEGYQDFMYKKGLKEGKA